MATVACNFKNNVRRPERTQHFGVSNDTWMVRSIFFGGHSQNIGKCNRKSFVSPQFRSGPRHPRHHEMRVITSAMVAGDEEIFFHSLNRAQADADSHLLEEQKSRFGDCEGL